MAVRLLIALAIVFAVYAIMLLLNSLFPQMAIHWRAIIAGLLVGSISIAARKLMQKKNP